MTKVFGKASGVIQQPDVEVMRFDQQWSFRNLNFCAGRGFAPATPIAESQQRIAQRPEEQRSENRGAGEAKG